MNEEKSKNINENEYVVPGDVVNYWFEFMVKCGAIPKEELEKKGREDEVFTSVSNDGCCSSNACIIKSPLSYNNGHQLNCITARNTFLAGMVKHNKKD